MKNKTHKRICFIGRAPILPPNYGGPIRVFSMAQALSKEYEVVLVSLSTRNPRKLPQTFMGVVEHYMFFPLYFFMGGIFQLFGLPVSFMLFWNWISWGSTSKDVEELISSCDIVVVAEPYLFQWVAKKFPKKLLILDEDNVEYDLESQKSSHYSSFFHSAILRVVKSMEGKAVHESHAILCTSIKDAERLAELYREDKNKFFVIPNMTYEREMKSIDVQQYRKQIFESVGKEYPYICVFAASEHYPNIEALNFLRSSIVKEFEDIVLFIVAGSISHKSYSDNNIYFTGKRTSLDEFFLVADFAINPIILGSGTNIKMMDYFYYNLPVLTTEFGARGCKKEDGEMYIVSRDEFSRGLQKMLKQVSVKSKTHPIKNTDAVLQIFRKFFYEKA